MNIIDDDLIEIAERLGLILKAKGFKIATAESCTGGLIAAVMTEIPGSSDWFDRGFVTYSNQAKVEMLGVNQETLDRFGAVSAETAKEMAAGALAHSNADWAVAVTGIAGPEGGSEMKPVGTVYLAWQNKTGNCVTKKVLFEGNRHSVRLQTVKTALMELLSLF